MSWVALPERTGRFLARPRQPRSDVSPATHEGGVAHSGSASPRHSLYQQIDTSLVGQVAPTQEFEGAPQDGIARTEAVRREIALEHATVGAERHDAGLYARTSSADEGGVSRTCRVSCRARRA
jgi:hypothetical protein